MGGWHESSGLVFLPARDSVQLALRFASDLFLFVFSSIRCIFFFPLQHGRRDSVPALLRRERRGRGFGGGRLGREQVGGLSAAATPGPSAATAQHVQVRRNSQRAAAARCDAFEARSVATVASESDSVSALIDRCSVSAPAFLFSLRAAIRFLFQIRDQRCSLPRVAHLVESDRGLREDSGRSRSVRAHSHSRRSSGQRTAAVRRSRGLCSPLAAVHGRA